MQPNDLTFSTLTKTHLASYSKRATNSSAQFLRWFLEHIFRLDTQDADDTCVDNPQDKGIDGIFVSDSAETIYLFQSKIRQKKTAELGDSDLRTFRGSLTQFQSVDALRVVLEGDAHPALKAAIQRTKLIDKLDGAYSVEGVFCCNAPMNSNALDYLKTCHELDVYDSKRIAREFVELESNKSIQEDFTFDISDTDIIDYQTSESVSGRIFLAKGLQLTHMTGISDGSLFQQNVRLSLGNTKVNKGLLGSIRQKKEHKNFPLYHNGITILCDEFFQHDSEELTVKNYMVVNGAQSLTCLKNAKASITDELRILVKVVALHGDVELSEKITSNSNNQNATKARDMRSNHIIQQRIKKEVDELNYKNIVYEVKRGEINIGKVALSNEDAGLAVLALDLGEPWNCHQRYKVMDESHGKIFGRPDVTGAKVIALSEMLRSVGPVLDDFEDSQFGHYNLTRYFLAHVVAEIIRSEPKGKILFRNFESLFNDEKIGDLIDVFRALVETTVQDLNVEIAELSEIEPFDYKSHLKNQTWCKGMTSKLKATYNKDVKRKKATPIGELIRAFQSTLT